MIEFRAPRRNHAGSIDCEINHHVHGWIPFTADTADLGAEFDVAALVDEMEAHGVAPASPFDAREYAALSKSDLCRGMMELGILSPADAVLAARGGWPALFVDATSHLSPSESADLEISWFDARVIGYGSPLIQFIAMYYASDKSGNMLNKIFGLGE